MSFLLTNTVAFEADGAFLRTFVYTELILLMYIIM